jgi:hypothetical protein
VGHIARDFEISGGFAADYITTVTYTAFDGAGNSAECEFYITHHPLPEASAGPDTTISFGDSVVLGGSPTGSGGTPPFEYVWFPPGNLSQSDVANPVATPLESTEFTLFVIDSIGCAASDQTMVDVMDTSLVSGNMTGKSTDSIEGNLDKSFRNSVELIPNPINGLVDVVLTSDTERFVPIRIEIFNILGEKAYEWYGKIKAPTAHQIDLSSHPNGQYLVRVAIDSDVIYKIGVLIK